MRKLLLNSFTLAGDENQRKDCFVATVLQPMRRNGRLSNEQATRARKPFLSTISRGVAMISEALHFTR